MTGKQQGFTLIELMVVLMIIAVLAGIVSPMVINTVEKAKESALKENLYVMRKSLDNFYADKGRYPTELEELVEEGYLRTLPIDPLTESAEGWDTNLDEEGGVEDVHSSYDEEAKDGSNYQEW